MDGSLTKLLYPLLSVVTIHLNQDLVNPPVSQGPKPFELKVSQGVVSNGRVETSESKA